MDFDKVLDWKAEGMRFSLFTTTPITAHTEWWADFAGVEPETSVSKASTGENLYTGNFESGILELRLLPDRIDWIFKANIEHEPFFPSVGDFKTQFEKFKHGLEKWLSKNDGVYSRLAFGAILLHPVDGIKEGNSLLESFVPFLPISNANWQDFYLNFNKITTVTIDDGSNVDLNRLINYSVVNVQTLIFNGMMRPASNYFTRLELDINTRIENNRTYETSDVCQLLHNLSDVSKALKDASEV